METTNLLSQIRQGHKHNMGDSVDICGAFLLLEES